MDRALADRGLLPVDGIALDIGVSSMQLDQAERGFSFSNDGPLDMRMSQSGETAADFLNHAEEGEIARVLKEYGEEPRARAVARAIVAARPLTRTAELAAVVRRALGYRQGQKSDPATRTFQAIRIHLNAELDELEQGLRAAERSLRPGGRLGGGHLPQPGGSHRQALPPYPQRGDARRIAPSPDGRARARPDSFEQIAKPVSPSEAELARNPRARSARLRTAVRTDAPAWDQEKAA